MSTPGTLLRAWAGALASLAIVIGIVWDISWHLTIGRDSAFSPPHLAMYAGVLGLAALSAWLVARATWAVPSERDTSVAVLGLRGPVGAWVCLWGVATVMTAVLLDAWWHDAYGLDVTLISVPHTILGAGFVTLALGAFLIAVAVQNCAGSRPRGALGVTLASLGGCLIVPVTMMSTIYAARPNDMHSLLFHRVAALCFPALLALGGRANRTRWPATSMAAAYTAIILIGSWVLQLVPATPRIGPVLNDVSRMVPPGFPLLLVTPAIAYDAVLARRRDGAGSGREWSLAVGLGLVFVLVFGATQWLLAEFLMSPSARNGFFAADRWPYYEPPGEWRYEWWGTTLDEVGRRGLHRLVLELAVITGIAVVSARAGLFLGAWMARLRR
jgi:hypothetical protein